MWREEGICLVAVGFWLQRVHTIISVYRTIPHCDSREDTSVNIWRKENSDTRVLICEIEKQCNLERTYLVPRSKNVYIKQQEVLVHPAYFFVHHYCFVLSKMNSSHSQLLCMSGLIIIIRMVSLSAFASCLWKIIITVEWTKIILLLKSAWNLDYCLHGR